MNYSYGLCSSGFRLITRKTFFATVCTFNLPSTEIPLQKTEYTLQGHATYSPRGNLLRKRESLEWNFSSWMFPWKKKKRMWRKNNIRKLDLVCIQCWIYTELRSKSLSSGKKNCCNLEILFFCTESIHIPRPKLCFCVQGEQFWISSTNITKTPSFPTPRIF